MEIDNGNFRKFLTEININNKEECAFCHCIYDRLVSLLEIKLHLQVCSAAPANIKECLDDRATALSFFKQSRIHIAEVLNDKYKEKLFPTYDMVFEDLAANPRFGYKMLLGGKADFIKAMTDLGYCLVQTGDNDMVIEDPKVRFEGYNYLKKITGAREKGKHIYYIDEIQFVIMKNYLVLRKPEWASNLDVADPVPKMFYATSADGCTNSLFCFHLAKGDYWKWVAHSLIPTLKPGSVIVMDNGFIQRTTDTTQITRYHPKKDMIQWLREHKIPCHPSMHKAELFGLIENCPFNIESKLSRIFKAHGHELVCLPCHLHQLTIGSHMMIQMNSRLENLNASVLEDPETASLNIKLKVTEAIKAIPQTMWVDFDGITKKTENQLLNLYCEMEDLLDLNYKFDNIGVQSIDCKVCKGQDEYMKIFYGSD